MKDFKAAGECPEDVKVTNEASAALDSVKTLGEPLEDPNAVNNAYEPPEDVKVADDASEAPDNVIAIGLLILQKFSDITQHD